MLSIKYDLPPSGVSYKQWRKQTLERAVGGYVFIFGVLVFFFSVFFIKSEAYKSDTINLKNLSLPVTEELRNVAIEGIIETDDSIPQKMFGTNTLIIKGSIILKLKQNSKEKILFEENYQAKKMVLTSGKKRIPINILSQNISTHRKITDGGKINYTNINRKVTPKNVSYFDTIFNIDSVEWNEKVQLIIQKEFLKSGEQVVVMGSISGNTISNPENGESEMFFGTKNEITTKKSLNKIISIIASLIMVGFGFVLYRKGTKYRSKLIEYSKTMR